MPKPTITRVFLGSVAALVAGALLVFFAIWTAFAAGAFVMEGHHVVGIDPTPGAWAMVGLGLIAVFAILGGCIGGLVAWIGALLNTARIEDKTWFVLLLVLGLFSFGFVAMIAYVIAGPDGTTIQPNRVATSA